MTIKLAFMTSVKIFIFTGLIVTIFNHIQDRDSFLLKAAAGKKSSKASSKTTVIAIDGGGGGGKAHPMPVPWPVVHCHHHHHHLKYVPKPVLVHHWVKKYKPYDFAETEHKIDMSLMKQPFELGNQHHSDSQYSEHGGYQPSILHPNKRLPTELMSMQTSSQLMSNLNNSPDGIPSNWHNQRLQPSSSQTVSLPPVSLDEQKQKTVAKEAIEKEIRKLQMNHAAANFNKILQSKQLNQLARSLLSNTTNTSKNLKYSLDEDSEDSFKSVSLANKTLPASYSNEQKFNNLDKEFETFADPKENLTQTTMGKSSSNNQGFFMSDFPKKPSHPFNEYHDQIIDESKQKFVSNAGNTKEELDFVDSLEQANLKERSEAELLFEKYSSENAGRMQALKNFHLMSPQNLIHIPALNQQAGGQVSQQQQQHSHRDSALIQPHINARMAGTLSESNTIEVMTKLAAHMAQNEAKKVLLRQNQPQKKQPSSNRTNLTSHGSQSTGSRTSNNGFFKNLKLLSLFDTPSLRNHRDRRRISSPSALAYQIHWPQNSALSQNAFATNLDGSVRTLQIPPRKQQEFINSYHLAQFLPNQETASSNLANLRDPRTTTSFIQAATSDLLSAQSSAINKVVDPTILSQSTISFDRQNSASANSNHQGEQVSARINRFKTEDQQNGKVSSAAGAGSRQVMLPAATIKAIGESNNVATTMSPEQENRFYSGQREHLSRIQRQKQDQASQSARTSPVPVTINEAKVLNGSTNATKVYNSSPSNVYDSVAHPSQPLSSTGKSQQSVSDADQIGKVNHVNLPSWEHQQQEQHQHSMLQPSNQLFSIQQQTSSEPLTMQEQPAQGSQQLYQQQLYPASADLLAPMSSYLEFPLSPQQWSSEAIKSMNAIPDSSEAGLNIEQNINQEKGLKDNEANDPRKSPTVSSMESASSQQDLEVPLEYLSASGRIPLQAHNKFLYEQLGTNQYGNMAVVNSKLFPQALLSNQNLDLQGLHSRIPPQMAMSPYSYFPQMSADLGLHYLQVASNYKPAYSSSMQHQQQHPESLDFSSPPLISPSDSLKATPSIDNIQSVIAFSDGSSLTDPSQANGMGSNTDSMGVGPGYPIMKTPGKNGKKSGVASSATSSNYYSDSDVKGISNLNQPDTMLTATNEMNQLRQFQNSLSQNVNHADNVTAMARLSAQLRDQMRTLQQRLPSMPNIPNVPQPPQIPNIPMPPPGMMQMAGLALPFAMARARENRIRNQQINAAANGGGGSGSPGSSTGQRLLNSASSFTNRLIRPRRRPNSPPATGNKGFSSSSGSNKNPTRTRRGFSNLVQIYVDMRKKPTSSNKPPRRLTSIATSAALSAVPKMRPKVDKVRENKSKRLGRSVDYFSASKKPVVNSFSGKYNTYFGNSSTNTAISPGSLYATMNDGSLTRFHSMTSPVDSYAQQLTQQTTQPQGSSQYKPYTDSVYPGQDVDEQLQRIRSADTHYNLNPNFKNHKVAIGQFERAETGKNSIDNNRQIFPIPLVANHINLLLFTAQNVTGSLIRPNADRERDQQHQQQQQQIYDVNQIMSDADMQRLQQQSIDPQTTGDISEQAVRQEQAQGDAVSQQQHQDQLAQIENSGEAHLSRLNSQSITPQGNKLEPASEDRQQEAVQTVSEENHKNISSQPQQSDHQQQTTSKEQIDHHKPDSTNYAPSVVQITGQNSAFKPIGSADEKNRGVPIVRTTRSPLVSARSIFESVSTATTTTTSPKSTSTLTSSTTALPVAAKPLQGNTKYAGKISKSSKWENSGKVGKFKRSTKRPANDLSNMQRTEPSLIEETSETINWSAQSASAHPQIRAATAQTTPMSKSIQTVNIPEEEKKSEGEALVTLAPTDATDYVRAIKLVRGVAYPWPPPTKSSKLFESQDTITSIAAEGA